MLIIYYNMVLLSNVTRVPFLWLALSRQNLEKPTLAQRNSELFTKTSETLQMSDIYFPNPVLPLGYFQYLQEARHA
jgi:hypothetical protein